MNLIVLYHPSNVTLFTVWLAENLAIASVWRGNVENVFLNLITCIYKCNEWQTDNLLNGGLLYGNNFTEHQVLMT